MLSTMYMYSTDNKIVVYYKYSSRIRSLSVLAVLRPSRMENERTRGMNFKYSTNFMTHSVPSYIFSSSRVFL